MIRAHFRILVDHVRYEDRGDRMDKYLRSWRQEALNKGQQDAAIYVGDKVLALTSTTHLTHFHSTSI